MLDLVDDQWRHVLEELRDDGVPPASDVHSELMSEGKTTAHEAIAVWVDARRRVALVTAEIAAAAVGRVRQLTPQLTVADMQQARQIRTRRVEMTPVRSTNASKFRRATGSCGSWMDAKAYEAGAHIGVLT